MDTLEPAWAERYKALTDYYKHLTTLSTGSIVLVTTFLDKLFHKPLWKALVVISIMGFMISVLASVVAYTIIVAYHAPGDQIERPEWAKHLGLIGIILTWTGFLVGILSLASFALRNFVQ
jgi:amino acid transporter